MVSLVIHGRIDETVVYDDGVFFSFVSICMNQAFQDNENNLIF